MCYRGAVRFAVLCESGKARKTNSNFQDSMPTLRVQQPTKQVRQLPAASEAALVFALDGAEFLVEQIQLLSTSLTSSEEHVRLQCCMQDIVRTSDETIREMKCLSTELGNGDDICSIMAVLKMEEEEIALMTTRLRSALLDATRAVPFEPDAMPSGNRQTAASQRQPRNNRTSVVAANCDDRRQNGMMQQISDKLGTEHVLQKTFQQAVPAPHRRQWQQPPHWTVGDVQASEDGCIAAMAGAVEGQVQATPAKGETARKEEKGKHPADEDKHVLEEIAELETVRHELEELAEFEIVRQEDIVELGTFRHVSEEIAELETASAAPIVKQTLVKRTQDYSEAGSADERAKLSKILAQGQGAASIGIQSAKKERKANLVRLKETKRVRAKCVLIYCMILLASFFIFGCCSVPRVQCFSKLAADSQLFQRLQHSIRLLF